MSEDKITRLSKLNQDRLASKEMSLKADSTNRKSEEKQKSTWFVAFDKLAIAATTWEEGSIALFSQAMSVALVDVAKVIGTLDKNANVLRVRHEVAEIRQHAEDGKLNLTHREIIEDGATILDLLFHAMNGATAADIENKLREIRFHRSPDSAVHYVRENAWDLDRKKMELANANLVATSLPSVETRSLPSSATSNATNEIIPQETLTPPPPFQAGSKHWMLSSDLAKTLNINNSLLVQSRKEPETINAEDRFGKWGKCRIGVFRRNCVDDQVGYFLPRLSDNYKQKFAHRKK